MTIEHIVNRLTLLLGKDQSVWRREIELLIKDLHSESPAEALVVYNLYPRKAGRPVALRAINKAIARDGFDKLVRATTLFAEMWQGGDLKFCPMPATWFNQERYNDDPSTWGLTIAKPNVDAMIRDVQRQIDSHPCNPTTPSYWKLNGRPAPDHIEVNGYAALRTRLRQLLASK